MIQYDGGIIVGYLNGNIGRKRSEVSVLLSRNNENISCPLTSIAGFYKDSGDLSLEDINLDDLLLKFIKKSKNDVWCSKESKLLLSKSVFVNVDSIDSDSKLI